MKNALPAWLLAGLVLLGFNLLLACSQPALVQAVAPGHGEPLRPPTSARSTWATARSCSPATGLITPAHRGKGNPLSPAEQIPERTPAEQRAALGWAQRLKRVFKIDVQACPGCGGTRGLCPESRAPPAGGVG